MKALFPKNCRLVAFILFAIAIFTPFILFFTNVLTDYNLQLVKSSVLMICMVSALLLFFSKRKSEGENTEKLRAKSLNASLLLTFIYLFISLIYHLSIGDVNHIDSSSFLMFLIISDICLEYFVVKSNYNKNN